MDIHVVQPGETLCSIALQYSVDPLLLAALNGVAGDGRLAAGQALLVRKARLFHIVAPGDSLWSIAKKYDVSLRTLYRNNYWLYGNPDIWPGQVLVIRYKEDERPSVFTTSYAYPFILARLLSATLPYMTAMAPFTYGLDKDGDLRPLDDERLLSETVRLGAAPLMHLSNLTEDDVFSEERSALVLFDPVKQATLTAQVFSTMERKGYRGLDVDFENLPAEQRLPYAQFLTALRKKLAPMGYPLMAAVAPKVSDDQPGQLYEGHGYPELGKAVDYLLLMTYEWGYAAGPPMAVAPLPQVRQVLDYAVTAVPREKILLGIPNYGYNWPIPFEQGVTRAQSLSNQEAVALAIEHGAEIQYDEEAQSPWFRYTDQSGQQREVWFEDARSLLAKLDLITEYQLRGCGFWNLMRPWPQGWATLNGRFHVEDSTW